MLEEVVQKEKNQEAFDKNIAYTYSSSLRENIGHHLYGELWAQNLKQFLQEQNLLDRPIHIISANLHSVMNSLYGVAAKLSKKGGRTLEEIARSLGAIK